MSTSVSTAPPAVTGRCPLGTPWCFYHENSDGEDYCETARHVVTVAQDGCADTRIRYVAEADLTPELVAEMGDEPSGPVDGQFFWILRDTFTVSAYAATFDEAPRTVEIRTGRNRWGLELDEAERLAEALMATVRAARSARTT